MRIWFLGHEALFSKEDLISQDRILQAESLRSRELESV